MDTYIPATVEETRGARDELERILLHLDTLADRPDALQALTRDLGERFTRLDRALLDAAGVATRGTPWA